MAEREGFEPSEGFKPFNGLANRPVKPLRHLSVWFSGEIGILAHAWRASNGLWRRERDSNPRALRLPVFKTGGFNHSPTPPEAGKRRFFNILASSFFGEDVPVRDPSVYSRLGWEGEAEAIREEGGYPLMPEWGTHPSNHYLPRRKTKIKIHEDELTRVDNPLKKEGHLPETEEGSFLEDSASW